MSNIQVKLQEISIYSKIGLHTELSDLYRRNKMFFGTVEGICNQYGIKVEQVGDSLKFTAPKQRMQHLVEKLHFARVGYSVTPY